MAHGRECEIDLRRDAMRCDVRSDLGARRFLDEKFVLMRQSGEDGVEKVRVMGER